MLNCQKKDFNLEKGVTYLNCGYMSPMHTKVEEAGINGILMKRNPHKVVPADFFSDVATLKDEFARIINTATPERIAIVPSVSYGMANVANNLELQKGDQIVLLEGQFPSNYYPWSAAAEKSGAEIISIPRQVTGSAWNEMLLDAIGDKVKLVALPNVHWADGTVFDLEAVRKKTREHGALMVIDGTQSVGALPFDMKKIQADALVCAGYKCLMGPYSIGLAYYGEAFDNGVPIENNWISRSNSEDFRALVNYQHNYQLGASRYSVGEHSNFVLLPMMLQALRLINGWGVENIQEYCYGITKDAITELSAMGYMFREAEYRASNIFSIEIPPEANVNDIKEYFNEKKISVSFRGDSIRVTPNVYNDKADLDNLVQCLRDLL